MSAYNYGISSNWSGDAASPSAIGENLLGTLDKLSPLDPEMSHWRLLDFMALVYVPIDELRSRMTEFVEDNVQRDDFEEPEPLSGYRLNAVSSKVVSEDCSPRTVSISVNAGSKWNNDLNFKIGSVMAPPDTALVTYPIYRGALEAIVSAWPCPWAHAYAIDLSGLDDSPPAPAAWQKEWSEPYEPPPVDRLDWIGYLSARLAAGLTAPADLICERTPGGGVILSATRDRFDLANPDHRRRGRMLTEIMSERTGMYDPQPGQRRQPPRVGPY